MTKKIAMLATDGFEQSELFEPLKALKDAGHKVEVVSVKKDKIKGWKDGKWGKAIAVDHLAQDVKAKDYDAIVIPGGVMNPDKLRTEKSVINFLKGFAKANKPIAAICHAPWVLIDAGIAKDKKLTSYKTIKADLVNAGAKWSDKKVIVDGNLITSRQPEDIPAFNEAILKKIQSQK